MLSPKEYLERQGLPAGISSDEAIKLLGSMMSKSIGTSMVGVVVEVLGTVETQELSVRVSTKVPEEMN